jgi:hypothetical protein
MNSSQIRHLAFDDFSPLGFHQANIPFRLITLKKS